MPFTKSDSLIPIIFFIALICCGALLLLLPGSYRGNLSPTDAFFVAAAAVCNAGFSVLELCDFSLRSHIVILFLIQLGAMGIIAFSVIILIIPGARFSFKRQNSIQNYYLDGVEYNPNKILRNIILLTVAIELTGALALYFLFKNAGERNPIFNSIFHSVSAFCNTGFSTFQNGLSSFASNSKVILVFSILIFLGGIGFIVINDVLLCAIKSVKKGKNIMRHLSYHSKVVLGMTAVMIVFGTVFFFFMENHGVYKTHDLKDSFFNALFQSINTRSGGFEITSQADLHNSSKLLTGIFMFIGGAPGSIAGGIKLTVVFVLLFATFKKSDCDGDINVLHRRITRNTVHKATAYLVKTIALLLFFILLFLIVEPGNSETAIFEILAAFTTAGLSMGGNLTIAGKWVMILAMFCGRIGLIALAMPVIRHKTYRVTYPEGRLLL
ncbi:MAG: TrkH family potassium uptake protein [Termitinemataceae bacterium]|nr:MAG: TrkH family potassium uptake protein [Termitinemataceae bacterium]